MSKNIQRSGRQHIQSIVFHGPYDESVEIAKDILLYTLNNYGGTFDAVTGDVVDGTGYSVGGFAPCITVPDYASKDVDQIHLLIARFLERIPNNIHGERHYHLGTWVDEGTLYIDGVKLFTSLKEAVEVGHKHGELSIYSFDLEKVLWLDAGNHHVRVGSDVGDLVLSISECEEKGIRETFDSIKWDASETDPAEESPAKVVPEGYVKLDDVLDRIEEWAVSNDKLLAGTESESFGQRASALRLAGRDIKSRFGR